MPIYADYTAEDLAQDDFFREWVQQPDSETNLFWSDFLTRYPEKQPVVVAARALLKAVSRVQVIPSVEQGNRMWAIIDQHLQEKENTVLADEPRQYQLGFRWQWLATAASIALVLGIGWWFMLKPGASNSIGTHIATPGESTVAWIEKMNTTRQPLSIQLADGSRVVLEPQTKLSYPEKFSDQKREVSLTGDGFFEVVKNPRQPFLVYANGLITQVVGTSFRVKTLANLNQVTVAVRTGKVAVFSMKAFQKAQQQKGKIAHMLLLTPNQQALFEKDSERLTKSLVKEPALIKKPENNQHFVFDNTPVTDVFQTLEESYGVTIKYDPEALKRCNLTAPLGDEPLFRKLDLICQTIGATYEVWETQIVITGKGCN
ncbi:DUF4974 domain-containing protein [Spirosoma sp. KCTC 42546]|uniref:FecR family protein n=1 Tax=Spirosoma sp. KCTC 42546 TaxID=2520506 RepID=UPI00115827CA|nr:FecR domain-containing protein [Spirosoma sp. KCTC 42546]QDK77242.1 DUF4974 domain-containing protein [Spirosoma sp. KCTC 42546]